MVDKGMKVQLCQLISNGGDTITHECLLEEINYH